MKSFRRSFDVFTIFLLIFGFFFTLTFILLLPYMWIAITGTAEFGLTYGSGMMYVAEGFDIREDDPALADIYFDKAQGLFEKADEQFAIINQKYPNMKLGTRKEFAKAVAKGDIGGFIKFVKTQNVTMDEAMKMAEQLPIGKQNKAKEKLKKQYKTK